MTSKYQDFSESLVVLGEPKCTSIFPTKGPHAGKENESSGSPDLSSKL